MTFGMGQGPVSGTVVFRPRVNLFGLGADICSTDPVTGIEYCGPDVTTGPSSVKVGGCSTIFGDTVDCSSPLAIGNVSTVPQSGITPTMLLVGAVALAVLVVLTSGSGSGSGRRR